MLKDNTLDADLQIPGAYLSIQIATSYVLVHLVHVSDYNYSHSYPFQMSALWLLHLIPKFCEDPLFQKPSCTQVWKTISSYRPRISLYSWFCQPEKNWEMTLQWGNRYFRSDQKTNNHQQPWIKRKPHHKEEKSRLQDRIKERYEQHCQKYVCSGTVNSNMYGIDHLP